MTHDYRLRGKCHALATAAVAVETDAYIDPPHVFCSTLCYGRCVGVA